GGNDEIGSQENFETRADGITVDRADDRLLQSGQFGKAIDSTLTIVGDIPISAGRSRFVQIPAGGKKLLAPTGKNSNAQIRVVSNHGEDIAELSAGWLVDGIGLWPVERDLQYLTVANGLHLVSHQALLLRIRASTAIASSAVTMSGLMSSSSSFPACSSA